MATGNIKMALRRFILPAVWIFCFFTIAGLSYKTSILYRNNEFAGKTDFPQGYEKNSTGGVRYVKYSNGGRGNPVYSIYFSGLSAAGRQMGVFRTPVVKELKIRDLNVEIYRDFEREEEKPDAVSLCMSEWSEGGGGLREYLVKGDRDWSAGLDLSNITKVEAADFRFAAFDNGTVTLEIRGKRAELDPGRRVIILRGSATVRNGEGEILRCNNVCWDALSETFSVSGLYVLEKNGQARTGRNINLDYKLNPVTIAGNKNSLQEERKCYASR